MRNTAKLMTLMTALMSVPWAGTPLGSDPVTVDPIETIAEATDPSTSGRTDPSRESNAVAREWLRTDPVVPAESGREADPPVDPAPLTAAQEEMVAWASGLFDDAGLPLPELSYSFHETRGPCAESFGAYRPASEHVSICFVHPDPDLADARQRRVLVHELAHAWAEHHVDEQRKAEFMEVRGAEAWRSPDLKWSERGTEQAADIVTWGLMDRDIIFLHIEDKSCAELELGFRTLTGLEPTAGLIHNCGR